MKGKQHNGKIRFPFARQDVSFRLKDFKRKAAEMLRRTHTADTAIYSTSSGILLSSVCRETKEGKTSSEFPEPHPFWRGKRKKKKDSRE